MILMHVLTYSLFHACNIAATLAVLKMSSTNDTPNVLPNAQSLWMQSTDVRKAALDKICQEVSDSCVDLS